MSDRLRVGFIGAGFIGGLHAQSWQHIRYADIMGVVEKNKSRAGKFVKLCKNLRVGSPKIFNSVLE